MNFQSKDMRRNPFPVYDQVRTLAPVLHDPGSDSWMIFDYENAKRALNDHEAFSSALSRCGRGNPDWFIFFDPPRHTRLRALVMRAFTPRIVARLEPRIGGLARELLDRTAERGEMDVASDFAVPLPMMVIGEMLGVPTDEWPRFRRWGDAILGLSYSLYNDEERARTTAEYFAANDQMKAWLPGVLDECRAAPKDDLLSGLAHAEVEGERLSDREIMGFFQLLLVAGTETTTNLINNAVLCLMEHRDQLRRLAAQPELMASAIEEVLRYRSPLQFAFRATLRDVEMGGHVIPRGKLALPVIGSANRDPKVFPEPGQFDIARDPNPHIAFGHGIHFCLGAPLARLEGRVALTEFLQRVKNFDLASREPWEPRAPLHVHGPARLEIRFERVVSASS